MKIQIELPDEILTHAAAPTAVAGHTPDPDLSGGAAPDTVAAHTAPIGALVDAVCGGAAVDSDPAVGRMPAADSREVTLDGGAAPAGSVTP